MTLSIFQDTTLDIPLPEIFGKSLAILGIKGSGKSNSAARISEQLLKAGVPMVIVDIAGEYWGLKEQFSLVVAGKSPNVDLEITSPHQAAAMAVWSLEQRISVILDLSDYDDEMRLEVLKAYLHTLWMKAGELRRPYFILLEEAHNWIPQAGNTPVTGILVRIATEGRKRGLGIIMVGQRSARLDKNVLTQADVLILHRVRHPSDVSVYQDIIPLDKKTIKQKVVALATGEALLVTDTISGAVARVLPRETFHAGYTPGLDDVQPPGLHGLEGEMLDSLRELLAKPGEAPVESRTLRLEARITELLKQVEEMQDCIERLTEENTLLSKLKVEPVPAAAGSADMHVETMHVGRMNGTLAAISPVAVAPVLEASPPVEVLPVVAAQISPVQMPLPDMPDVRSDLATTRAINKQNRNFDSLLWDIQQQPFLHRRILAYCLNRSDSEFTGDQLARYLGVQPKTLKDRPPLWLVEKGLLRRYRWNGAFYYTADDAFEALERTFPDLNHDALWERLVNSVDENRG